MYGHLDKQPEFSGWRSDLQTRGRQVRRTAGPGRGGADDGYAMYTSIAAVQGEAPDVPTPHRRPDRDLPEKRLARPDAPTSTPSAPAWAMWAW